MTIGNQTPERTIGQLVSDATNDLSSIVRGEIELAKTEITSSVSKGGKGVGFLVGAGVLALYMFGVLLLAGAWGIVAAGLPVWAGLLIVAGVLLIFAAGLGLWGYKLLSKANPKPERAIKDTQLTVNALKSSIKPDATS